MTKYTDAEQKTQDYLNINKSKVIDMTIEELSQAIHVSPATIIRTLKKDGFSGYSEYKNFINDKYRMELNDFSKDVAAVISKNMDEVAQTIKFLRVDVIEEIVKIIDNSTKVYIFSTGTSTSVAEYIERKLYLMGMYPICIDDDDLIVHFSKLMTSDDVAIFISQSGTTKCLLNAAEIASELDVQTVLLTCNSNSKLSKLAKHSLVSYKSPLKTLSTPIESASRFSLEMIARILIDSYIIYKDQKSIKRSY